MHKQPLYVPHSDDFVQEHNTTPFCVNDGRAQEELDPCLERVVAYLSSQLANPGKPAYTSAGKANVAAQSSSDEAGSTCVGSRSTSQAGSGFNGTRSVSTSGSGTGSTEYSSGNMSGGSYGYGDDGSTCSGSDNISDGSSRVYSKIKRSSNLLQAGRVKLPPGLADGGSQHLGMPMKVEMTSNLSQDRQHAQNKSLQEMTSLLQKLMQGSAELKEAGQSTSELRDMEELLAKVLLQVAGASPPEDTTTRCSASASGLAAMLPNRMAMTRSQEVGRNEQLMQALQRDIEKTEAQRVWTPPQSAQNQVSWEPQGLEQDMMILLQQEFERQGMRTTGPAALSAPAIAPPACAQHVAGLGLKSAMPPQPSQLLGDWQLGRLIRQELESGWLQPEAQAVTPHMIETDFRVSTEAAHQAAAAWQQEQASLAWQQQSALAWQTHAMQQAREAACNPPGMAGPTPLHQMSDPNLQRPRHTTSGNLAHMMNGESFLPFSGAPMSVPLPMQTVPTTSTGHKVYREDGGAKGQPKGAGKGCSATNSICRSDIHKGHRECTAPPEGSQGGFEFGLKANLETLRRMDCNCIVQVRKINKLGFESGAILEEHFSHYGKVNCVLVSHCYANARNMRIRPSGLGFVVMSAASEVQAILADGPEIQIHREVEGITNGITIHVQAFSAERTPH